MNITTGDFISWVDPDDIIDIFFYENLINRQIETGSDIVIGSYCTNIGFGKIFTNKITVFKFEHKIELMTLWSVIYNSKIIKNNKIEFPDLRYGEDVVFSIKCVYFSNHVSTCPEAMYFYEKKKSDSCTHMTKKAAKPFVKLSSKMITDFFCILLK